MPPQFRWDEVTGVAAIRVLTHASKLFILFLAFESAPNSAPDIVPLVV
jgi:hypothetical protein